MRQWTSQEISRLVTLCQASGAYDDAAEEFKLPKTTIRAAYRRACKQSLYTTIKSISIPEIERLKFEGKTWAEVGESMGLSTSCVKTRYYRHLREMKNARKH